MRQRPWRQSRDDCPGQGRKLPASNGRALFRDVAYADGLAVANPLRPLTAWEEMDKKDKDQQQEAAKPANTRTVPKQPRWPGLGGNSGIKNAKSVHGRMPTGRGSARGR